MGNTVPAEGELVNAGLLSLRPGTIWQAFRQQPFGFAFLSLYLLLLYLKPGQAHPWLAVIPIERIVLLITIAGFLLEQQFKITKSSLNWLLLLFLAHCVISSMLAFSPSYAFSMLDIIVVYVLVYFVIIGIVNSERRLYLFFLVYLLANFKMSEFGFASWVRRGLAFANWGITGAGWYRNSGELGMEMAMFCDFILCFAIYLRKYWSKWTRLFIYYVGATGFGSMIATSSRGAILAFGASLLFLTLFSRKKIKYLAGATIIALVGYTLIPNSFLERFDQMGKDITSITRLDYWDKARLMMNQHPSFGVGYYNWIPYYRAHYFNPDVYWRVEMAHNTFLQLGAELGYVGLALFVLMTAVTFVMNARSAHVARLYGLDFLQAFAVGMNVAGVSLVIGSYFLTAYWLPSYWIQFALTVCLRKVVLQAKGMAQPIRATA